MHVGWLHVAMAGAWGALVGLERRAFLQAMFSRPLVAATGMGLLLGQTQTGLYLGMILELFYLGTASLGAALPENDTLAASGTTAAAVMMASQTGGGGTPAIWSLSLILFSGLGLLGRLVDRKVEAHAAGLSTHGLELAEAGELERAVRQNLFGIWPYALVYFALNAACAALGMCDRLASLAGTAGRAPWARLGLPGDGLGGGGHRGARLARPECRPLGPGGGRGDDRRSPWCSPG